MVSVIESRQGRLKASLWPTDVRSCLRHCSPFPGFPASELAGYFTRFSTEQIECAISRLATPASQDEEVRSASYWDGAPDPLFNERSRDKNLFDLPPPSPKGEPAFSPGRKPWENGRKLVLRDRVRQGEGAHFPRHASSEERSVSGHSFRRAETASKQESGFSRCGDFTPTRSSSWPSDAAGEADKPARAREHHQTDFCDLRSFS